MKRVMLMFAAASALAGCNQGGESNAIGNSAAASKSAGPKRPTYCFFKNAETKSWSASAGRDRLVTVKGRGHVKDPRYRAQISESEITATQATVWLTIGENRGYASPDNWWVVSFKVPGSAAVTDVTVLCGKKIVAELKIRR